MIKWKNVHDQSRGYVNDRFEYLIHQRSNTPRFWVESSYGKIGDWVPISDRCETLEQAKQVCEMHHATGAGE